MLGRAFLAIALLAGAGPILIQPGGGGGGSGTPSDATPANVSTTGAAGTSTDYSRADHAHDLTFTTWNAVAAEANAAVSMGAQQVRTSATPSGTSDLTNKSYVDTQDATKAAVAGQIGGTASSPTVLGIRETSGPTLLTTGTIADGECLKRSGSTLISATCGGGGSGYLDIYHFQAESLDPANTDWPTTASADIIDSVATPSVQTRNFLGASATAAGNKLTQTTGVTSCRYEFVYQAASAPGTTNNKVRWRLDFRALGTTGAMTSYTFADQTVANNATMAIFADTETNATTGMSANTPYQFQVVRVTSGVTNGMTQNALLSDFNVKCN